MHCGREGRKRILVFRVAALNVAHGAINVQPANVLVAIGLWQGNPKMSGASGICVSGNTDLICEFKRPRRRRFTRFGSSCAAAMDGNQGKRYETENQRERDTEASHVRTPVWEGRPGMAPI